MIRLSYTLKCWALGVTYFLVFYFMVVMSDPGFSKYLYAGTKHLAIPRS